VTYGGVRPRIPGTMGPMHTASQTPASPLLLAASGGAARSSRAAAHASRSLGSQLERDRLERRAARVRQVIHALRERAAARDTVGGAPRPLRAAIEDFGRELAELERRLRSHHRAPAERPGR